MIGATLIASTLLVAGWNGEHPEERPIVRLLVGGGFQNEPTQVIASIFADGRFKTASGEHHGPAVGLIPLRTRLRRLQKVTQDAIDAEIARSGIPEPAGRNATPRYGLELRTTDGHIRMVQIWSPKTYRSLRLSKVDTFLSVLDAVAAFSAVKVDA